MPDAVKPIPDNYPVFTPYISVRGAADAIEFYKRALGAEERYRLPGPDGTIGHAELQIADGVLMLADEGQGSLISSPQSLNGASASFSLYVEDADTAFARAIEAGATEVRPVADQFYGDRTGTVRDPFGHFWSFMTHIEDVSPEEMERRMSELVSQAQ